MSTGGTRAGGRARALLVSGLLALPVLCGCGPGDGEGPLPAGAQPIGETPARIAGPVRAPTWAEAANADYAGPMGLTMTLENGEWRGESYAEGGAVVPQAGLVRDFLVSGDLDGDGRAESLVVAWVNTGGTGTFHYLSVVERRADGTVAERASAELGDRVQVRGAEIRDGRVELELLQAGPEDPRCCPGRLTRRSFVLEGDTLAERASEDLAPLPDAGRESD